MMTDRFFLISMYVICHSSIIIINARGEQYCRTPQNKIGKCIIINECPSLKNFLVDNPKTDENINYLQEFLCGFQGITAKVCCQLEGNTFEASIGNNSKEDTKKSKTTEPTTSGGIENMPPSIGSTTSGGNVNWPPSSEATISDGNGNLHPSIGSTTSGGNGNLFPSREVCGKQVGDRILGGELTTIKEYPWMALLEYETGKGNKFMCGGALINNRYVLTAGHCIPDKRLSKDLKLISVRLGEYDISKQRDCIDDIPGLEDCSDPPIDVTVEKEIPHKLFNRRSKDRAHDIALLRLSKEITYSDYIIPICLPTTEEIDSNPQDLTVAGWGITENDTESEVKLKVELPVVSNSECSSLYEKKTGVKIGNGQICAGGDVGKDSCRGDSGGPLMLNERRSSKENYVAVGIVSFGLGCGVRGFPAVYTRVSSYIQWIMDNIKE